MPPKKKARLTPSASSPTNIATGATSTTVVSIPAIQPSTPSNLDLSDPWTPEQETSLFKALIRYKPTGVHKHFHMLCISSFLRSHGHCASSDRSQSHIVQHTRIPSIWSKLSALYDLEALDEREDSYTYSTPEEESTPSNDGDEENSSSSTSNGPSKAPPFMKEFALPSVIPDHRSSTASTSSAADDDEDSSTPSQHPDALEFTELIWQKRFHTASDAPSSPPEIPFLLEQNWRKGTGTTASPAPSGKRGATGRTAKAQTPIVASGTRRQSKISQAQATPATATSMRKGRGEVKADSEAEDESEEGDDEEVEDDEDASVEEDEDDPAEDEEEEEEEEDEEEEEEEANPKSTPARSIPKTRGASKRGKASTGRGGAAVAKGRGGGGGRGRGRGRGAGRKRG